MLREKCSNYDTNLPGSSPLREVME